MRLRFIGAAALAAVLVGTAATLAWARVQADTTIQACVATSNGDVRIPAAGQACKKGEARMSWNTTGPAGPQGPQGVAGPQGPAGASGGAAPSPDAIQGSFTATGARQGAITGDGPGGSIVLVGSSHAVISPRDAASGLPTGKRQHKPFTIVKEWDRSTPLLLKALVDNENLTSVTFTFTRGTPAAPYMTVRLTNASVASRTQTGGTEEISFTYQKIVWTWVDGGITAEDDWEAPAA